jgi:hypothetical protein
MVLTNLEGRVLIAFFMASLTDTASLPAPRCKSSVKRVERSTSVPTAERLSLPMIRSPSQCPALPGRLLQLDVLRSSPCWACGSSPCFCCPEASDGSPTSQAPSQLSTELASSLDEEGLIDLSWLTCIIGSSV